MMTTENTAVTFDPHPLQVPASPIYAPGADDTTALPRDHTSRRIDFMDDGKLFEGHFTLHTRSLKNMIQLLVDQQSEQRVIINDLQDQMNTLRQQATKMKKMTVMTPTSSSREGSVDVGGFFKEFDNLRNRVKVLEGFKSLWGIRSEEIESLISIYGDPVITPEEYTACILNLQPFRVMRNDTRNSIISLVESRTPVQGRPMSSESSGKARTTRDRTARETSRVARDDDSRASHDDGIRADRDDSRGARADRDESRGARADRDESRGARTDRDESRGARAGRDESRGARTDRDESRGARADRDESRGARAGRDESRAARADRDDSRGARADRDESRGARADRDDSRGARADRDESRGARSDRDKSHGARTDRDESRGARSDRDKSRGARSDRDKSRGARTDRDDSRGARADRGDDFGDARENDPREASEGASHGAEFTSESLVQLMSRVDTLERRMRRSSGGVQLAQRQLYSVTSDMVDEQARQDLEELERFVVRRFKELDRMLAKPRGVSQIAATKSANQLPGKPERVSERVPPASLENNNNIKSSTESTDASRNYETTNESKPRKERKTHSESATVDQAARDDVATALDRVDNLERFVTRKIKELSVAVGKDMGPVSMRPSGETAVPAPVERRPQGPMVDQMARDDAARSLELVQELEEEWGKRWQSLEERLRIIGRAAIGKGSVSSSAAATASSIDRKAREDASMSLLRIQQLEREIVAFRRLLQKHKILDPGEAELADTRSPGGGLLLVSPSQLLRHPALSSPGVGTEKTEAYADADHETRMRMLEQEVELRMSEVNRALTTLRSTRPDSGHGNNRGANGVVSDGGPLVAGQVIIGSSESETLESQGIGVPFPPTTISEAGMLIVNSRESPSRAPVKMIGGDGSNVLQLRSPQLGGLGAPLVTRDMNREGMVTTPPNVLSLTTGVVKSDGRMDNGQQNSIDAAEATITTTEGRHGENALSVSREVGATSITADAWGNAPAAASVSASKIGVLRNIKLPLGEGEHPIGSDRTGELNQLRSHSTRLRNISVSARGRIESGFSTEPSALGHTTPCVVYNCAWCAAQKRTISPRTQRTLR